MNAKYLQQSCVTSPFTVSNSFIKKTGNNKVQGFILTCVAFSRRMKDILNIGGEEDLDFGAVSPTPVLESRLKYGTGMRINAALKVLAEKRAKRKRRKQEVSFTHSSIIVRFDDVILIYFF